MAAHISPERTACNPDDVLLHHAMFYSSKGLHLWSILIAPVSRGASDSAACCRYSHDTNRSCLWILPQNPSSCSTEELLCHLSYA